MQFYLIFYGSGIFAIGKSTSTWKCLHYTQICKITNKIWLLGKTVVNNSCLMKYFYVIGNKNSTAPSFLNKIRFLWWDLLLPKNFGTSNANFHIICCTCLSLLFLNKQGQHPDQYTCTLSTMLHLRCEFGSHFPPRYPTTSLVVKWLWKS